MCGLSRRRPTQELNIRPISFFESIIKILERILCYRLRKLLLAHNLIDTAQLGSIPKGRVDDALLAYLKSSSPVLSSYSASPAMFHAPKDMGGLGIFTFHSLANQSLGTELLVRLQSPTLSGKVARSRLRAMEERFPDHSRDRQPNTRYSFTLHCISRLRRIGYELATPANYRTLQAEYGGMKSLEDSGLPPQLLRSVTKLGFRFQSDLFDSDSSGLTVKVWEDIRCRAKAKNPTAWYTALLEFAETHSGLRVLDAFNTHLPRPSVTRTTGTTRGYQPADIAARAVEAVEIRQGAAAAAPALLPPFPVLLPPDINGYLWRHPEEIPPLAGGALAAEFLFFATDGSVKEGCGSYASVTPHRTAHWTQHGRREPGSNSLFYARSGGRTQYGAEAVAIDAMELMAVVDTSLNFSQDGELFRYHSFSDSGHVGLDNSLFSQHEGKSFGTG